MKRVLIAALLLIMVSVSSPAHAQQPVSPIDSPYRALPLSNTNATSLAWNKDGSKLLVATDSGRVYIWAVQPNTVSYIGNSGTGLNSAAWSHDETRILTTASDGSISVWDVGSGKITIIATLPNFEPNDAKWNHDESQILITGNTDNRGRIYIWDVAQKRNVIGISLGDDSVTIGAVWNHDETRILSGSVNGVAAVWDAATSKQLFEFTRPGMVTGIAWNADGSQFLTTSLSNALLRWDTKTGKQLRQYAAIDPAHSAMTEDGVWNAQQNLIIGAANTDNGASIYGWNAATGQNRFEIHIGQVLFRTLAVGPGSLVAAAQSDGGSYVRIWNTL